MNIDTQAVHDLVTRQIDLMRYERSVRRDVLKQLEAMREDVQTLLAKKTLPDLSRRELNTLLSDIETVLSRDYDLIGATLQKAQSEAVEDESAWLLAWLGAVAADAALSGEAKGISETETKRLSDGIIVAGMTLPELVAAQKNALMQSLKQHIRLAAVGEGVDIMTDIADAFARKTRDLQTLTATWIQTLAAQVHTAFGKVNPLVKGYRHVSILDGKTSSVCAVRHGLVWNKQYEPIGHNYTFRRPALHPNCRSKLVFVFDLDAPFEDISGEDWVKGRTLEELQEQFGKGIGQMLHDGTISLSDAVKLGGLQAATLDELRRKFDPVYIVPLIDTAALKGARFTQSQLRKKFKHASDFGIDTRRSNPRSWKAYQEALIRHMENPKTRQFGTYRGAKGSKVFYNDESGIAAVFSDDGYFMMSIIPSDDKTLQLTNYLKNGFLQ